MALKRREIIEIEKLLNSLEQEVKKLKRYFLLKDFKKFSESKREILMMQKKIKVLAG